MPTHCAGRRRRWWSLPQYAAGALAGALRHPLQSSGNSVPCSFKTCCTGAGGWQAGAAGSAGGAGAGQQRCLTWLTGCAVVVEFKGPAKVPARRPLILSVPLSNTTWGWADSDPGTLRQGGGESAAEGVRQRGAVCSLEGGDHDQHGPRSWSATLCALPGTQLSNFGRVKA